MSNTTTGKHWTIDTAGTVFNTPFYCKNVHVTWKVSSAGSIELQEYNIEDGAGPTWFVAQTLGATSAAVDQMTQVFYIDTWIKGLSVKTLTNVGTLLIQTE